MHKNYGWTWRIPCLHNYGQIIVHSILIQPMGSELWAHTLNNVSIFGTKCNLTLQYNISSFYKLINKQISIPLICSTMACRSSYVRGIAFLIFYMWKEQGLLVKPYEKSFLALPLHLNLRQYKHCKMIYASNKPRNLDHNNKLIRS